jgi:hypothetical protein
MHRSIRSLSPLILGMFALMSGCSESSGPSARPVNQLPSLIVSSLQNQSGGASADVVGGIGWVSLPPGSVPDGQSASIRSGRSGTSLVVSLVDGGFDPIAISATVGDSVFVDITRSGNGTPLTGFQVIAIRKAPSVVRTSPAPGKKDVPLNAAIVVVFSAPVDSATLSATSFGLLRGGTPVAGLVRPVGTSGISAEFYPDSTLAPQTSYQLFVTQAIHDVNGVPLGSAVTGTFSTGSTTQEFPVGGSVTGLAGTGLVLSLNNIETLPVAANGAFQFSTRLAQGAAIDITVLTLPSNPSQLCTVAKGSSTMPNGPYTSAAITCSTATSGATGKILFTSTSGDAVSHIFVLDLDHSTVLPLTSGANDDDSPRWSPDRTRIAFLRGGDASSAGIWVMNANGSQQTRVSPVNYSGITWSADGTRLLVISGDTLRTVSADGSGAVDVGIMSLSPGLACLADPAWSPNGATIAASCTNFDNNLPQEVYLMNSDGSNLRRLSNLQTYGSSAPGVLFAEAGPAWSPSGLQMVFWSFGLGVTVANIDGSNAYSVSGDKPFQGVLSVSIGTSPDWSPDGKWIVYRNASGQLAITLSSGAGTPTTVTSITAGASSPAWSR